MNEHEANLERVDLLGRRLQAVTDAGKPTTCPDCPGRVRKGRDQAEARLSMVVSWLADQAFPYNWHSSEPAPAFLRLMLAQEYAHRDDMPVEDVLWALDEEQAWR